MLLRPRRIRLFAVAMAVLVCTATRAQTVQRQNWTTEEGLPQNSVHALLQSRDGYLWAATEAGAARFNGLHFQRYYTGNQSAFLSNDLCCIAEGRANELYFGSANGAVRLNNGVFTRLAEPAGATLALQREDDGGVLALTTDGLFRLRGITSTRVDVPGSAPISALGATEHHGVLAVAGSSVYRVLGTRVDPVALQGNTDVKQAVEDGQQRLWLASGREVLLQAHGRVEARWVVGQQMHGSRIESLTPWRGGVLVGTNQGASVLRGANVPVESVQAMQNDTVLSAMIDREGDAWFGTDSTGLSTLRERVIDSEPLLQGEPVTAVATAPDGTVWAGTRDAGLRHFRPGDKAAQAMPGLASHVVLALATDRNGGVWVGSPEGLDHVAGKQVTHVTAAEGLPDDFVRSLLPLPDGTVWVGTRRGAAEFRGGGTVRVLTEAAGLPSDVVGAMLRDRDGSLWIGTLAGLARVDAAGVHRLVTGDRESLVITSLAQAGDGVVWVGTADGLKVVHAGQLRRVPVASLQGEIAAVLPDGAGNLWLRTAAGIVRGNAGALLRCATAATQGNCLAPLRQYGLADGMPSTELGASGHPVAAAGTNGTLWFATRRGLAALQPGTVMPSPVAPGIVIEQAIMDERSVPLDPEIEVGAGKRRLQIHFAGLSLRAPGQVRYRYQLDGFDRDWSPWEEATVADYTNLPPGIFRFRVQAVSADGVRSRDDATTVVRVDAPFYRHWWFYALLLLAAAGVAYGLYWLRLRRVRRDFATTLQERNRIAREIHDTLAQDFVAVSLQLEVTSQLLQAGAHAAAKEQVDATRLLVRNGIQDARESIWALRAASDQQTLPARLQAMVHRQPGVSLHVSGPYRALSPSQEREFFRVAKEAVGNAVRHAGGAAITVALLYSEDAVLLRVSDDGAGFDVEAASSRAGHYGVRGMHERATAMGATLQVRSAAGDGTTVELRLPAGLSGKD